MPHDLSAAQQRCRYCSRPGSVVWSADLRSCNHGVCETLAFAELRRRERQSRFATPGGRHRRFSAA